MGVVPLSAMGAEPGGIAALPWWNPDGATPGGGGGSCVAAYQAKGAASYAASLVNLSLPGTYDLTENAGAVSWTVAGWAFLAASVKSFNTGIIPALNQTWSSLIQFAGMTWVVNSVLAGFYDDAVQSGAFYTAQHFGANSMRVYNGDRASPADNVGQVLTGNYGFAGITVYENGLAEATSIPALAGTTNIPIYIGAVNYNNVAVAFCTGTITAYVVYNVILTAPRALARAVAMAAL